MISKTHISGQKPGGRQLNTEVCDLLSHSGNEYACTPCLLLSLSHGWWLVNHFFLSFTDEIPTTKVAETTEAITATAGIAKHMLEALDAPLLSQA